VPLRDPIVRRAIRDALPLYLPVIPFALVLGVAITESAIPTGIGWSTNVIIFAGAAQLATVSLAATATWLTLVTTATVINLRHLMYSVALSPRFGAQPRWFRWVGPYVLIDQVFALVATRDDLDDDSWRRYFLSCGLFFFTTWNVTVTVGLLVGSEIPESWRLDVAPALMFASLVVVGISNRPGMVAALVGAVISLVSLDLPNNTGILVGAVAGIIAGSTAEALSAGPGSDVPDPGQEVTAP
jgi:predicted branched-subunit amino acid permease